MSMATVIVNADETMQVGILESEYIRIQKPRKLIIRYPQQNPNWVREIEYDWCKDGSATAHEMTPRELYEEIRNACLRLHHREESIFGR